MLQESWCHGGAPEARSLHPCRSNGTLGGERRSLGGGREIWPPESKGDTNFSGAWLWAPLSGSRPRGPYFCEVDPTKLEGWHQMVNWVGLMGGFYILVLVVEHIMVKKWYYNWSPGSSLTRLKGPWGQVWPEIGPKLKLKFRILFPTTSPTQLITERIREYLRSRQAAHPPVSALVRLRLTGAAALGWLSVHFCSVHNSA